MGCTVEKIKILESNLTFLLKYKCILCIKLWAYLHDYVCSSLFLVSCGKRKQLIVVIRDSTSCLRAAFVRGSVGSVCSVIDAISRGCIKLFKTVMCRLHQEQSGI